MTASVPISPSLPAPGQPNLKVPKTVNVELGETVQLTCHSPCKFYSYKKFWCKWTDQGCSALPSQDEGSGQAVVNCDQNSQLINLTLKQVTKGDEGWYWCGVKEGLQYRETVAVYVAVKEKGTGESPRAKPVPPPPAPNPRGRLLPNSFFIRGGPEVWL